MRALSTRLQPVCCLSRSARRPRPPLTRWPAANGIASASAGVSLAPPTIARAKSLANARCGRAARQSRRSCPALPARSCSRRRPYSAIKVDGHRAYALARAHRPPALTARPVQIAALRLIAVPDRDHADCEALVGKGTYIRALSRDLGIALGTCGHVAELRRLSVGRFTEAQAISLDSVVERRHSLAASEHLLPIETALDDIPALALTAAEAARLRCGQRVTPHDIGVRAHLDRLDEGTVVSAWHDQAVIALAKIENGGLQPARVINR